MGVVLQWGQATHPGKRRARNEDAMVATGLLFAVADGMGGHEAGDVAAAIAVEAMGEISSDDDLTRQQVLDAVRRANREISDRASGTQSGMGTTLSGLAVTGAATRSPSLLIFNVGDSRTYRLRQGEFEQLTHDHSVVQELVDAGTITSPEADRHPERHIITRSLGAEPALEIDWWIEHPTVGDRYLIASDGLSKELDVAEIASVLAKATDVQHSADLLTEEALASGGRDNITVVVIDVVEFHGTGASDVADPLDDTLDDNTEPRIGTHDDDDDTQPGLTSLGSRQA